MSKKLYDFVTETPAQHILILRAYKIESASNDPFHKLSTMANDVLEKINPEGKNIESDIDFDISSLSDTFKKIADSGSYLNKGLLDRATKALEYMETGGRLNPNQLAYEWLFPIPNNLRNELSHTFSTTEAGVGSMLNSMLEGDMTPTSGEGMLNKAINFGTNLIGRGIAQTIKTIAQTTKRQNMNFDPKVINAYNGTATRSLPLEFTFIPFSSENAKEIFEGLLALKAIMTGEQMARSANIFIANNYVFTIKLSSRNNDMREALSDEFSRLTMISPYTELNLSEINIEYLSDKQLLIEGLPKSFNVRITVQERRPYRRGQFDAENNKYKEDSNKKEQS